jgi:2-keto-4-pentenoate hydratase/2-oxohepta-3-ene-1,7-dioic acid hydratase in catechol pathway
MKLVNFHARDGIRTGRLIEGGVEDLAAAGLWRGPVPVDLAALRTISSAAESRVDGLLSLKDLLLAPAVIKPEKIICVGLNYRRHAIEANMPIPTVPVIFGKFANSLAASGDRVCLPQIDTKYDYEAELGVVIGREARDVRVESALDYVAGYCCANDLSARGAQLATSQWTIGKALDGFLPLGPCLVTTDEVPDPQDLSIVCRVNGEVRQDSSTGDMIFAVAEIIAFLSRYMTLKPGDIIITGTPEGVLMGHKSPTWLKAGDEVSVEIGKLGILANTFFTPETSR